MKSYINGYQNREELILFFRNAAGALQSDTYPADQVAYFKTNEVKTLMKSDRRVLEWKVDKYGWARAKFKAGAWNAERINKWSGNPGCWVPFREEVCREWGVPSYEADVTPLRRLYADNDFGIQRPKRVYFDIETDSRAPIEEAKLGNARVLCWAAVDEDGNTWSDELHMETDEDESRLLRSMWNVLGRFDQVCAWSGDGFDFPVIKERSRKLGVDAACIRRLLYMDQMLCFKRNNIMSAESGDEKQSYKLDAIATALLGEGKHDVEASKSYECWRDERAKLVKYCIQDTDLLRRIEKETGYLELFMTVCEVTHCFPDSKSLKPTKQVDSYMLRLGAKKGIHFKTTFYGDTQTVEKFPGAYVMDPQADGITKDVHIADFASLYPSIMITWNLSPDVKDPHGHCVSPSTKIHTSNEREGIICTALKELLGLRADWKKKKAAAPPGSQEEKDAERRTNAYKTAANSFYGVLGTPYSRFYDRDLVESTTQNGAWLIKTTIAAAEAIGWKVIYADTDSLFVTGPTEDDFQTFITECNTTLYPSLLADQGTRENYIKLASDKYLEHIVFTSAKRYVAKQAGNAKPQIKGLEYKRGDVNKMARQMQKEVIDLIVAGNFEPSAYEAIVGTYRERIATEPLSRELVVVTKTIDELAEYTANLPQVRIAREMQARGEEVSPGTKISYVIVDGRCSPKKVINAADYTGVEVDRDALWFDGVYPPTQRLLTATFPKHNWVRWSKRPKGRKDPRQTSLF